MASTLPLLASDATPALGLLGGVFLAISATPRLLQAFNFREALSDQVDLLVRRGNSVFGFFLEGMQHVHRRRELRGVHGSMGVGIMPRRDLHHASAADRYAPPSGTPGICVISYSSLVTRNS